MAVFLSGVPRVGLWHSPGGTITVEGVLFALCVWLYVSATRATGSTGRVALGALIGLLGVMYLGFMFGPPMPSPEAVAYPMLAGWLIPFWGRWIEQHRTLRVPAMTSSRFDSSPT